MNKWAVSRKTHEDELGKCRRKIIRTAREAELYKVQYAEMSALAAALLEDLVDGPEEGEAEKRRGQYHGLVTQTYNGIKELQALHREHREKYGDRPEIPNTPI